MEISGIHYNGRKEAQKRLRSNIEKKLVNKDLSNPKNISTDKYQSVKGEGIAQKYLREIKELWYNLY